MCPQCWISVRVGPWDVGHRPLPQQWLSLAKSGVFPGCGFSRTVTGPREAGRCFLRAVDTCFSSDRDTFGKFPWDGNIPSSLPEQEQYHFCYDIALEYLESLETR